LYLVYSHKSYHVCCESGQTFPFLNERNFIW
jgi:hypothetical protein